MLADNLRLLTSAGAGGKDNPGLPELEALIKQLRHSPPSSIHHDLVVIADFDQSIVDAVRAGKRPQLEETPELGAALQHEAEWTAEHCAHA